MLADCRRDGDTELWELGSPGNLSYVLAYIFLGHPITPPLICPDGNEIRILGGHHRYAVTKASGEPRFPIYARPRDLAQIAEIVPVAWIDAAEA